MNAKIYKLAVLVTCIGLLLTGFSAGIVETNVTLYSSGVIQQTSPTPTATPTPTGTYSYIISISSSNYQILNSVNTVIFSSTSSSIAFNSLNGVLASGNTVYVESGAYSVDAPWVINVAGVTVTFDANAILTAQNSLNAPVMEITASNVVVNNPQINGNAANQKQPTGGWTDPNGISIGGCSNVIINNPTITNVRSQGIDIWYSSTLTDTQNTQIIGGSLEGGWNGITDAGYKTIISDVTFTGATSNVAVSLYGVGATVTGCNIHDLTGTTGNGGGNARYGIAVEGNGDGNHGASANTITNNIINDCSVGISINTGQSTDAGGNTITGNTITNCYYPYCGSALSIGYCATANTIYHNNFGNGNAVPVVGVGSNSYPNTWSNNGQGNYYSDYLTRYPSATQIGSTGIGNTHYYIYLFSGALSTQYDPNPLWAP
jgi:hypothetical protein